MRIKKLFKLGKGYWYLFFILLVIIAIQQYLFSNTALFTQYLLQRLSLEPGVIVSPDFKPVNVNFPKFLSVFLDSFSKIGDVILWVAITYSIAQVTRALLGLCGGTTRNIFKETIAKRLRDKLYVHIENLSYNYHNRADKGDLIQRVTSDVDTSINFLSNSLVNFISLILTLIFGTYQLSFINPTIVYVLYALMIPVVISSIVYFNKIEKIFTSVEETESAMTTVIQENVSGVRVVKAFSNEKYEIDKMEEKNMSYQKAMKKANFIEAIFWGSMDTFSFFQYFLVVIIFSIAIQKGQINYVSLVACLQLVGMLIWPIRGLGRIINDFSKSLVASKRLYELLDLPVEYENDGTLEPAIEGKITFDHVSFKFSDTDEHLLNDISFEIEKGSTVALIGKTGSGKSTIVNLLLRMMEYDQGSILIDGIPLKDIKKHYIRKNIGTVLQDPFLFSKTVYENISITNKSLDKTSVYRAAKTAALEKDIKTFQSGYETKVGEEGTSLSGGQRQRVAIARVLLESKPILIFDDSLSALDSETDMMIRSALMKENKQTTIIITHRIFSAKEADKIIVLGKGNIEAIGTHKQLIKKEGLYKRLWDIQGNLEEEFLKTIEGDING